jgi:metallophosphoesterase (TIGR00282 family)
MRVLFIGDVMAEPGLRAVGLHLPDIRDRYDLVIANGENAARGKGLDRRSYRLLREAGVDLVSLGNHAWDHKEVYALLESEPVVRPLNYPPGTPGKGFWRLEVGGESLLFVQVMGRIFMDPLDDPFRALDRLLEEEKADYVLVEVHAEATSEKMALAHYLDGRASAVLGTHTHVPTADARILPRGTAYVSDVGMVGAEGGLQGYDPAFLVAAFRLRLPPKGLRLAYAAGPARVSYVFLELEGARAKAIVHASFVEEALY